MSGQRIDPVGIMPLLAEHGALGFRRVLFSSPEELLNFSRMLGSPVAIAGAKMPVQLYIAEGRAPTSAEEPAPLPRGSDFWHSDNSYNPKPASVTVLYSVSDRDGTSTHLCDASLAFDTLDASLRQQLLSERYLAEHDSAHGAGTTPTDAESDRRRTAVHPLLRAHPATGRVSLYLSPLYTRRLLRTDGSPLPEAEGASLLRHLLEHTVGEGGDKPPGEGGCVPFEWEYGSLLLIDNARMLHRATTIHLPKGTSRSMLRVSLEGKEPIGATTVRKQHWKGEGVVHAW